MPSDNNIQAFLSLLNAGLWEDNVRLMRFGQLDYKRIYSLAVEQAVVGLVAAGLEHLEDVKIPQEITLQFVGTALQLEQKNLAMNEFINALIEKMRQAGICSLLIK